mmetsp:Transcript_12978/g.48546  ORF Transcript_12978/g.48546 Transcript_12978/m.48546 type:complete len:132 (-) Transcript_12978:1542-1937(-)
MITTQCLFYLSLALMLEVLVGSEKITTKSFFDASRVTTSTTEGRWFVAAFVGASLLMALALCAVVGRAKKCLDFAVTAHVAHFVSCCFVAGVPRQLAWWVTCGMSVSLSAIAGEYLCAAREMRDIPTNNRS